MNYAGVVGDPNPIHYSDEIVKAAGLDGVVAHGMQTMGLGATYVSEFIGDPGAFCEYNVRFHQPGVRAGRRLHHRRVHRQDQVAGPGDPQGTIALVAKQADRRIFGARPSSSSSTDPTTAPPGPRRNGLCQSAPVIYTEVSD